MTTADLTTIRDRVREMRKDILAVRVCAESYECLKAAASFLLAAEGSVSLAEHYQRVELASSPFTVEEGRAAMALVKETQYIYPCPFCNGHGCSKCNPTIAKQLDLVSQIKATVDREEVKTVAKNLTKRQRQAIQDIRDDVKGGEPWSLTFCPTGDMTDEQIETLEAKLKYNFQIYVSSWILPRLDKIEGIDKFDDDF
jgi:hypothetical protein